MKTQRTAGPEDHGTREPVDQRTTGPEDHGTRGPRDQRTRRPKDRGTRGPETTGPRTTGPRTRRPQGHGLGQTFQKPNLGQTFQKKKDPTGTLKPKPKLFSGSKEPQSLIYSIVFGPQTTKYEYLNPKS